MLAESQGENREEKIWTNLPPHRRPPAAGAHPRALPLTRFSTRRSLHASIFDFGIVGPTSAPRPARPSTSRGRPRRRPDPQSPQRRRREPDCRGKVCEPCLAAAGPGCRMSPPGAHLGRGAEGREMRRPPSPRAGRRVSQEAGGLRLCFHQRPAGSGGVDLYGPPTGTRRGGEWAAATCGPRTRPVGPPGLAPARASFLLTEL